MLWQYTQWLLLPSKIEHVRILPPLVIHSSLFLEGNRSYIQRRHRRASLLCLVFCNLICFFISMGWGFFGTTPRWHCRWHAKSSANVTSPLCILFLFPCHRQSCRSSLVDGIDSTWHVIGDWLECCLWISCGAIGSWYTTYRSLVALTASTYYCRSTWRY